jgi:hypothetical protein
MVTLSEIHMPVCERCGGDLECRVLVSSFGCTFRVTRCRTLGCVRSKPLSERPEPVEVAE